MVQKLSYVYLQMIEKQENTENTVIDFTSDFMSTGKLKWSKEEGITKMEIVSSFCKELEPIIISLNQLLKKHGGSSNWVSFPIKDGVVTPLISGIHVPDISLLETNNK